MLKKLLCLYFSLIFCAPLFAEESTGFYDDRKQGYYWYHDDVEKEEKEKLPKYDYQELWNMHPDQFQKYFDQVTKLAVQYPTEEHAVEYLKLKDMATRKSMAFSSVVSMVNQQHPEYAADISSPSTAPGQRAVTRAKMTEINNTILNEKDHFALVMFVRNGCDYCVEQDNIIQYFENLYSWDIRKVDIDENPALATKFNIQVTPTILIVHEDGEHLVVSYGVVSMADIQKRVYRSIRYLKGEISQEQWFMYDYEKDKGADPLQNVNWVPR
ncbi:MAG: conjugal transfer protein TraF [Proteobacteria bacterium]|nr:conjugal transfer protein TraF [Pseudomonadota bacterium]